MVKQEVPAADAFDYASCSAARVLKNPEQHLWRIINSVCSKLLIVMAPTAEETLHSPLLFPDAGHNKNKGFSWAPRIWKWLLAALMWATFLFWIAILVAFPAVGLSGGRSSESGSGSSSVFGFIGLALLLFAVPIFVVAVLAAIYLDIKPSHVNSRKKSQFGPRISLWTCPLLVNGLLGVVSAAELLFIVAFVAYIIWAMGNYIIHDRSLIERFMKSSLIGTRFKLWELWTYIIGLRIGLLGLICLAFLFLPVARGSPLLRLIDIPFEHAVKYHVWLGHLTMAIFTLHGLCYVVVWAVQGQLVEELLAWQRVGVANLPGVISLVAGLLLWMTSFGIVRQGFFELFFYTHQLYVVFVVFMAFHIGDMAFCICMAGIFLYMLDRFLRFCQSRRAVKLLSSRVLPCGTIELLLSKPQCLNYNSLSFIFLNLPSISWLQWHPFSVSSSPYDARENMSFLIKPLGSWTEDLQKLVLDTRKASGCPALGVEGPYGHESDYYLKYEALVLVAGGIGVSPFIAMLRDLLHRHNMSHDGLPREVTLVWAVKSSRELSMINLVQPNIICPQYSSRLKLTVLAYVTREAQPDAEDAVPCIPEHILSFAKNPSPSGALSTLVGTYSNFWIGLYIAVAVAGFFIVEGLFQEFYLGPLMFGEGESNGTGTTSWTVRAGVLLFSMIVGVVLFGGLVVFCWNWIESCRKLPPAQHQEVNFEKDEVATSAESLVGPRNTFYGQRPDLKGLFDEFARKWIGLNVGVLVCGPATLQSSVAAECRAHNTKFGAKAVAFHYHSVSFDL